MILTTLSFPAIGAAQSHRVYAGASVDVVNQSESDASPLGGNTWGVRGLVGLELNSRVAIEFEPSFNGTYSWLYSYRPSPLLTADVVASRRNAAFSGQVRLRYGVVEPVAGLSYIRGHIARHATIGTQTYFDDDESDGAVAAVAGLDVTVPVTSRVFVGPTIRLFRTLRDEASLDPFISQTQVGAFAFRCGAQIRVAF